MMCPSVPNHGPQITRTVSETYQWSEKKKKTERKKNIHQLKLEVDTTKKGESLSQMENGNASPKTIWCAPVGLLRWTCF